MSKRDSNWYIPPDWLCQFGIILAIAFATGLSCLLLPIISRLKSGNVGALYCFGLGAGLVGIILLLAARLPLYRARRFWALGPRKLDRTHRRLYWLAYLSVAMSLFLMWIVWLRTR